MVVGRQVDHSAAFFVGRLSSVTFARWEHARASIWRREGAAMDVSSAQPATAPADQPSRVPAAVWREAIRPFTEPDRRRTFLDLATSVVPYLALLVLTGFALQHSVWLALALAPLTAGFLLRTFILFHDCTHGSLFASRRANRWVGTSLGLLVYLPFERWGHSHAVHHATAGDLERRGTGDLPTLTVAEYRACS